MSAWRFLIFLILTLTAGPLSAQAPVESLLQKYCLGCHNETQRETGLSLQTNESLRKGSENGPVLNPDNPSESLLLQVLDSGSNQAMPPKGEPQPSDVERARLKQWVLDGARIGFLPDARPDVPEMKPYQTSPPVVLSIAVSPSGGTAVTGGNRFVNLTNVDSGEIRWSVELPGKVTDLSFSADSESIIAAVGLPGIMGKAVLLSAKDGSIRREFAGHTDAVYAATLNSGGTVLATAGYDRQILLHDFASGKTLQTLKGHNGSVFSLAFDPAGDVLCSASGDSTIKVWNVSTGQRLDTLSQPGGEQYSVIVSPDGKHIYAAGADNRIRIWQLLSRNSVQINPALVSRFAHEQTINRLAISRDGSLLASTAEDGSITVWTSWPLEHRQTLPDQQTPVMAMSFVGNDRLMIARKDGQLQTLRLSDTPEAAPVIASAPVTVTAPANLSENVVAISEAEDNNAPNDAQRVSLPATISGTIHSGSGVDADCFGFSAIAGQQLVFEVKAQQNKSPLDSRIEILTSDGKPILRTWLQAVRDSYFTFRGKDSDTSDDFRVFNWQEMELNEYLYSDGEVVRLWLYPRGPDSGFVVYPGFGKRHTYFGTTATAHALQAPCFIVTPRAANEPIVANGLPVFPIHFENDDDPARELGTDSRLIFTAPTSGNFVVRLTDARGFSGPDYKYDLTIRSPNPSFRVTMNSRKLTMQTGTGREIEFKANRIDGYEGPIAISASGLPAGFAFSSPVIIQPQQLRAYGTVYAVTGAVEPTEEQTKAIMFSAAGDGIAAVEIGGLEELKLNSDPKLRLKIGNDLAQAESATPDNPTVLQIRPGETIRAILKLERINHDGIVSLGKEGSGRNLPHGVFVDNIGLNGLLLLDGDTEREFFITAAKWVPQTRVPFHLKANVDGVTSLPVYLEVLPHADASDPKVTATNE